MSDLGDTMRAYDQINARDRDARDRDARYRRALTDFPAARQKAGAAGLKLEQFNDGVEYRLTDIRNRWVVNFYPSNQRIYAPRPKTGWNRPPFLSVSHLDEWTLLDVVNAALVARERAK